MLINSLVPRYNSPVSGSFLALEVKRHLLCASLTASLTSCDLVMLAVGGLGGRRAERGRDSKKKGCATICDENRQTRS